MNLMELFVKIGVDDQASSAVSNISSKIGNGLKTAAKIGTAAISAVSAGVVALGKASIDAYADYEQLVGGVETLFGAGGKTLTEYAESVGKTAEEAAQEYMNLMSAQSTVLSNADKAYKTAGLSANNYMETVTSFSASLIQSLEGDTVAAATAADQAIIDMADNANKMGTDISMIQNAYQGFAKQNYTMLDNLKLGYGGTQKEMYRLMQDAAALDETFDADFSLSSKGTLEADFADIVQAIHIVQTEMGITGTTALEASTTISGSVSSMKAAWENLLVGIADDNQDFTKLVTNFVDSATTVFDNLMPRIQIALQGVVQLIEGLAPSIIDAIPELISDVLPTVVEGAVNIVTTLVDSFADNSDTIVESGMQMILTVADGLLKMLPTIIETGLDIIIALANGIAKSLPELIPTLVDTIFHIVNILTRPSTLSELLTAGLAIINELANGLTTHLPVLVPVMVDAVLGMVETLTDPDTLINLLDAGLAVILALADGIIDSLPKLLEKAPVIISNLISALSKAIPKLLGSAAEMVSKIASGIIDPNNLKLIGGTVGNIIGALVDGVFNAGTSLLNIGWDIISGIWEGIKSFDLLGSLESLFGGAIDGVKDFFGIASPSKLMKKEIGRWLPPGIADGFSEALPQLERDINKDLDHLKSNIDTDLNASLTYGSYGSANGSFSGGSFGGTSINGTVININVTDSNASPERIAEEVGIQLEYLKERRSAVYG